MRRRIVISIVGVAVVALLVLGIPLALALARLDESQEVLRLEREANEARSSVSTSALVRGDSIELGDDGKTRFAVYDASGHRVGGNGPGPERADAVVRKALDGDTADTRVNGRIDVAVPVNGDQELVGAIRASRSAGVVVDRTRLAWILMGVIALGAVVVAAVLAWWQARRLTRPIDELVGAARRLGGGDFSVRTHPSGINELDQWGAALDTTAERLGDLVARERAFSTNASHQLRTPIAGLRVKVESALLSPDTDARATLEEMLGPIDRLETTLEDLLRLARDAHVDRSPLDIAKLLGQVGAHWQDVLAADGRPLQTVVEDELTAPVVAEPAIRQILEVLLANAWRHGAGTVTLAARASAPGAVVIQVGDEGSETLDARAVFDRQTDGTHGVGLGLARALAEAEGSRLILERPGPRPIFAVVIPTAAA